MRRLLLFLLIALSATLCAQESAEDYFQKVFGKAPPSKTYGISVQVYMDTQDLGQHTVQFNPFTNEISLNAAKMRPLFIKNLIPSAKPFIEGLPEAAGLFSTSDLLQNGFKVDFQQQYQHVFITSPSKYRHTVRINLGPNILRKLPSSTEHTGSPWSGYINLSNAWINTNTTAQSNLKIEQVHSYRSLFSVENELRFQSSQSPTLDGLRVVHDDPDRFLSYYVGDIRSRQAPNIVTPQLWGLSAVKSYQAFGSDSPRSVYQFDIVLEDTSFIQLFINDRAVYNQVLDDGKYEIFNPNLREGKNTIRIQVAPVEQDGVQPKSYTIIKEVFFHDSLLKLGEKEYSYTLGKPYSSTGTQPRDTLVVGANSSYGYSRNKVLNGTFTVNGQEITTRGGLSMVSSIALWDISVASTLFPYEDENPQSLQLSMRPFRREDKKGTIHQSQYNFSIQTPAAINGVRDHSIELNGSRSLQFLNQNSLHFRLASDYYLQAGAMGYRGELAYQHLTGQLSFTYLLGFEQDPLSDTRIDFSIRMNRSNHLGRIFASLQRTEDDVKGDLSLTVKPLDVNGYGLDLNASRTGDKTENLSLRSQIYRLQTSYAFSNDQSSRAQHSVNAIYSGNRQTTSYSRTYSGLGQFNSTIRMDTALAYAGTKFGITDRVNDSFIIMHAPSDMEVEYVEFNDKKRIDFLGAAVLTNISINRDYTANVVSSKLNGQHILQQRSFQTFPLKRQGVAISIAPEGQYALQGNLFDGKTSEPLTYAFGEAYYNKDRSSTPVTFFTNKHGRFIVTPVKSGVYELVLYTEGYKPFEVTVTKQEETYIQLGDIYVELE